MSMVWVAVNNVSHGQPVPPQSVETPSLSSLLASRVRVYPKSVHGPVRAAKWGILGFCLGVYYLLPWLRWTRAPGEPDQALLLDIWHERFYFFNLEFWPQDIYYLTGCLIMAAVSLFLVTSLFGRVWCGYACPQTVWTDLYMFVERQIEGDRPERMKRDEGPRNFGYVWRKTLKHAIWLFIAFWTGGAWIMYYVNAPTAVREFWTGAASAPVYFFTFLFTTTTYVLAGWAREQVCTYMCPWPRFQAAMLDEQSITVTYQTWRGEPRARHVKREDHAAAAGDCIDCLACVTACPTGIDIRDGNQMECINCGLCIDACNTIMDRVGKPRGLVTWDTLARQSAKESGRFEKLHFVRARTLIYLGALTIAATAMVVSMLTYARIGLTVEHDRAPLFVRLADGSLRNGYTLRLVNKTQLNSAMELSVAGMPDAKISVAETNMPAAGHVALTIKADSVATYRVLIASPAFSGRVPLTFSLHDPNSGETTRRATSFIGPDSGEGAEP
jgi:cytochrome c oxidase accessory protein FixG